MKANEKSPTKYAHPLTCHLKRDFLQVKVKMGCQPGSPKFDDSTRSYGTIFSIFSTCMVKIQEEKYYFTLFFRCLVLVLLSSYIITTFFIAIHRHVEIPWFIVPVQKDKAGRKRIQLTIQYSQSGTLLIVSGDNNLRNIVF